MRTVCVAVTTGKQPLKNTSKQELLPATRARAMASYTAPAASPAAGAHNGNDVRKEPGRTHRSSDHLCLRDITWQKFQDVKTLHLKQHEYP